jgi:TonB family protein
MLKRVHQALFLISTGFLLFGCESSPDAASAPAFEFESFPDASNAYRAYARGDCAAAAPMSDPDLVESWAINEVRHSTLLLHAFCQELLGDKTTALGLYENLIATAPNSFAARDARDRLRVLEIEANDPDAENRLEEARERASDAEPKRAPVQRDAAEYPPMPREVGIEGYAVVEFRVKPNGETSDPLVLDSSPPLLFDGASMRAIRKWEYARDSDAGPDDRQVIKLRFLRDDEDESPASIE